MLLIGTLLALLSTAEAAKKSTGPEVAVVGVHLPDQTDTSSLQAALLLVEAMGDLSVSPVSPAQAHERLAGREALVVEGAALGPGRRKREEGRILYDRADVEGAIPVLQEAVGALEIGLSGTGDPRELVQALLLLGQAQWSIGETDAATDAFTRVVVLEPSRQLDSVNYPPKIVSFFNDVRYAVLTRPKGRLQLQVSDRNVVLVDGRESLSGTVELIAGTHYALIKGPDGERDFRQVVLKPDQVEVLSSRPGARTLGQEGMGPGDRSAQTRLLYESLGTHVGTPLLLLGGEVSDGQVAMQLYEARTGSFSKISRARSGGDPVAALAGLLPEVLDHATDSGNLRTDRVSFDVLPLHQNDNPLLAGLLLDPEPMVEVELVRERQKRPWIVWASVGAVAAGGAAVTIATLATATGDDGNNGGSTQTSGPEGVILVGPLPE